MKDYEEIYIITDGCMWEQNKQNSTYHPHAIEVVNSKTGQVQYIKSGSRITFVEGEITETRSQEIYNKKTPEVSDSIENKLQRTTSKTRGSKNVQEKPNKD